jgi:hypothetical protein
MSDSETGRGATFVLDAPVEARLSEYAKAQGIPFGEALALALHMGVEFCERGRAERRDELDDLTREVQELKACLHALGPAVFGTNLLLVHWATTTGSLKVTAEELSNEFKAVARMEWALEMVKQGVIRPPAEVLDAEAGPTRS